MEQSVISLREEASEHCTVHAPSIRSQSADLGEYCIVVRESTIAPVIEDEKQVGAVLLCGQPAGIGEIICNVDRYPEFCGVGGGAHRARSFTDSAASAKPNGTTDPILRTNPASWRARTCLRTVLGDRLSASAMFSTLTLSPPETRPSS